MHNKIKIYIFHPYSFIGGADTSISRLINNLNKDIYKITKDLVIVKNDVLKNPLKITAFVKKEEKNILAEPA